MKIELYKWQKKALEAWKSNNSRGILSVVTGAGKTFVALKAIEELESKDKHLKTIIIVPTIALLNQWHESINKNLKIEQAFIGRSGSKYSDSLKDKKIMIYVANSALKFLEKQIQEDKPASNLFLIADECHRYGSPEFSLLLKHNYKYTLGLSATPERESDYGFEEYLEPNLGKMIFRYNYHEAMSDGVISPFKIINYGVILSQKEKDEYRKISDKIKDLRVMLEGRYPIILSKRDRYIAELTKHENKDPDVKKFLDLSVDRKRMLYKSESRFKCLMELVKEYENHKIMIFHEDVDLLNQFYDKLTSAGYNCAIVHYKKKKGSIEDFKKDNVRIFLSAKMFSEGVDLPDVDVGIIVASSSSVRQKIQTMGRILRKSANKNATIINIFIKDTTDERVFSKIDWNKMLGYGKMNSYSWPDKKEIELKSIEKKRFRSEDEESKRIDENRLKPGDVYTAQLNGDKYSFDSSWKLFMKFQGKRTYAQNQKDLGELAEMVKKIKPEAGSFFRNNKGHILVKTGEGENSKVVFAGVFKKSIDF